MIFTYATLDEAWMHHGWEPHQKETVQTNAFMAAMMYVGTGSLSVFFWRRVSCLLSGVLYQSPIYVVLAFPTSFHSTQNIPYCVHSFNP